MCKKDGFSWKPNISLLFNLMNNPSTTSVADPGEGPTPPPLFLDQTEARRDEKKIFKTSPPHLSQGLDYRTPSLSEGPDELFKSSLYVTKQKA